MGIENPPQAPQDQDPHVAEIPWKPGDLVSIRRSNGVIEPGWTFMRMDEGGKALVMKDGPTEDVSLKKFVTVEELKSWNSQ